jgi:hypothetical protein
MTPMSSSSPDNGEGQEKKAPLPGVPSKKDIYLPQVPKVDREGFIGSDVWMVGKYER